MTSIAQITHSLNLIYTWFDIVYLNNKINISHAYLNCKEFYKKFGSRFSYFIQYFTIFTETSFDLKRNVMLGYTTVYILSFYNFLLFKRFNIFSDIRVKGMYDCDIRSY